MNARETAYGVAAGFAMTQDTMLPAADVARGLFDPKRAKRAADWYAEECLYPSDDDVETRYAWRVLAREIESQYLALLRVGFRHVVTVENPYDDAAKLFADMADSMTLRTLQTEHNSHPIWSDGENDRFRFVHDLLGHLAHENDFSAPGEDAAYLAHRATLPTSAHAALACETRAQNAVLNYGPRPGEFARQICALTPAWLHRP